MLEQCFAPKVRTPTVLVVFPKRLARNKTKEVQMKTRVRQLVFTIAMLGCVLIATRDTSTYTAGYCTCFREFQGDSLHAYIYSDTPVDWNFLASEDFTPFQLGGATEYEG